MKCNAHVCIYKYVEPFIPHFEFHFSNTSTIKPTNKKMRKEKILSESTIQKLRTGKGIAWENIELLCKLLECQPGDLMEYIPD